MDTGRRTPLPSPAGLLARVAVAALGFLAVNLALRGVASPDGGGLVGAKRELLAEVGGEVDTLFLGSSHVYRGFDPATFDAAMAEAGLPTSSFNHGVQLPNLVELRYLTERALELADGGLRHVLVEPLAFLPQIDPANEFTPRAMYWHDLESTRLAVERTFAHGEGLRYVEDGGRSTSLPTLFASLLPADVRVASDHVQHALLKGLLHGRWKDIARGAAGRAHGQTARLTAGRGYLPLEREEERLLAGGATRNPYTRRRERFLEESDTWEERVAALGTEDVVFGDEEWINAELSRFDDLEILRAIVDSIRAAGAEPYLVITPDISCHREFEESLEIELGCRVLRYTRPELYPELYAPENRFDSGHLSAEGARVFSSLLARDVARGLQ